MPENRTIVEIIATQLKAAGIPHILVGGFAVNYYGYPRATQDIDFMIIDGQLSAAKETLEEAGFQMKGVSQVCANFQKPNMGLKGMDLLLVSQDTFDQVRKDGRRASLAGIEIIVPSLDHLIALKLHAIKSDPKERALKDLPDIVYLLRINKVDVRKQEFRDLCLRFGTPQIYEDIVKYFKEP